MKIYFQLLIFIFPLITYSQKKLEGTYRVPELSVTTYQYIIIDKAGNFQYAEGGDLGELQPSKGTYKFEDHLLILNFNNSQTKELSFHKTEIWRNQNDSIMVNLKVMDLNGNPLEHAWISKKDNKSQTRTDANGNGNFILEKKNDFSNFIISWVGFEAY